MDGSGNATHVVRNINVSLLTLDLPSRLLFWISPMTLAGVTESFSGIYFSEMSGHHVKLALTVAWAPIYMQIAGKRLYWISRYDTVLRSCEKGTGNNFRTHELYDWDGIVTRLVIFRDGETVDAENNPCRDATLCSHICVPTPVGQAMCLCPDGYILQPDSRNCTLPQLPPNEKEADQRQTKIMAAGAVGLFLLIIIIFVSFNYYQTKVRIECERFNLKYKTWLFPNEFLFISRRYF